MGFTVGRFVVTTIEPVYARFMLPTLEEIDYDYINIRSLVTSSPYISHSKKICATMMFTSILQIKSDLQELAQRGEEEEKIRNAPRCETCRSFLVDGACEKCTRMLVGVLSRPEPVFQTEVEKYGGMEKVRRWVAAWDAEREEERFRREYREQMDRIYAGEDVGSRPVRPSVPARLEDPEPEVAVSRFSRFGAWIRKKFLCGCSSTVSA